MLSGLKLSLPAGRGGQPVRRRRSARWAGAGRGLPRLDARGQHQDLARLRHLAVHGAGQALPRRAGTSRATSPRSWPRCRRRPACPTRAGKYPIDLGPDVVIINRLLLREADTGVDVILEGAYRGGQKISDGIPHHARGRAAADQQDRDHRRPRGLLPEPDRLRPAPADRHVHVARAGRPRRPASTAGHGLRQAAVRPDALHDRGRARQDERRPERAPAADRDRDAEDRRGRDLQGAGRCCPTSCARTCRS